MVVERPYTTEALPQLAASSSPESRGAAPPPPLSPARRFSYALAAAEATASHRHAFSYVASSTKHVKGAVDVVAISRYVSRASQPPNGRFRQRELALARSRAAANTQQTSNVEHQSADWVSGGDDRRASEARRLQTGSNWSASAQPLESSRRYNLTSVPAAKIVSHMAVHAARHIEPLARSP